MAKLSRLAGSTGHILTLYVQDATKSDGSGITGLTNASSGLACGYKRNTGSAAVVVTLDTIATLGTYGTYAAGHGGFKEIDATNLPGYYEFQAPDAAFASGAKSVAFMLRGATNMMPVLLEVELTAVDNQNGATFGLSGPLPANVTQQNGGAIYDYDGTFASSTSTTITLNSTDSGNATIPDNAHANCTLLVTSGSAKDSLIQLGTRAGAYQYNVVSGTMPVQPSTGDKFVFFGGPTASGGGVTASQVATAVWQDLTAGSDFGTTGSVGALVKANLDTNVGSRSTYAGGDTSGTTTLLSRIPGALTVSGGKVTATLDLTQAVPTSNTDQTVGDALNAARAQGFGKWAISGTTLTLYAADGTTAVRTFTLDSATAPTQRS